MSGRSLVPSCFLSLLKVFHVYIWWMNFVNTMKSNSFNTSGWNSLQGLMMSLYYWVSCILITIMLEISLSSLSTEKPFFNISFEIVSFFIYAFADSIKHGAESLFFSIYTIHKLEMSLLKVFSHLSILSPFVKWATATLMWWCSLMTFTLVPNCDL